MKKIKLTNDPDRVALVDDEDFEFLSQWNWQSRKSKNGTDYYAIRKTNKNQATFFMHSVIMNTPDGMLCDHINHNTLDNRRSNLRNVTPTQSIMNTKTRKDNALGVRGGIL